MSITFHRGESIAYSNSPALKTETFFIDMQNKQNRVNGHYLLNVQVLKVIYAR